MKQEVTCGYKEITENGVKYFGGQTDQGVCYKDMDAWKSGEGVVYISETEFEYLADMKIDADELYTRESWVDEVMSYFGGDTYPRAFYEYFAECVLQSADWQCLTTLMYEWEDDIDEDFRHWCSEHSDIVGRKVVVTIETTEYNIADALRDLANFVEETDTEIESFEGGTYTGTIKFKQSMNKTKTYYYQPTAYSHDGTYIEYGNIPLGLYSFQAFATEEDCKNWLENNGYNSSEYAILKFDADIIEDMTIIDEYGDIIEVNEPQ